MAEDNIYESVMVEVEMPEQDDKRSGQVYAEMLCDFMFKRIFGSEENKDVLIAFLNVMLLDVNIRDVTFIPTEHLGESEEDRTVIFDVACTCDDGRTFIIEMQKGYQKHFRDRSLFYTTYPINQQGRDAKAKHDKENIQREKDGMEKAKFRWDYKLKPVIVVAILNFAFEHDENWPKDRYHSSYRIREDVTGEVMTENLRFVFMELGRFKKKIWELESVFDKWMFLIKHIHELTVKPPIFSEIEFERLFLLAKISKFTAKEYKQYKKSLKHMSDYYNIIDTAVEAAEKRGVEKGREEGKILAAKQMVAAGIDAKVIADALGIAVEDLAQ